MAGLIPPSSFFLTLQLISLDNPVDSRAINMVYCYRCERSFRTLSALIQHESNSSKHHICHVCYNEEDFETACELREHLIDEHNGCPQCYDVFDSARDLREHLYDEHNMCSVCNRCFTSPSNLKYVRFFLSKKVSQHAVRFSTTRARLTCTIAPTRSP